MRRWQLLGVWLVAVIAATVLTWQIVSMADDRVGEGNTAPLQVTSPTSSTSSTASSAPTTVPRSTATTAPTGPTSSSSSSPPTTPTSQPSATPEVRTIPTQGGTLTVSVSPGSIKYLSAVPATGFAVEVDDAGPPEVRVEFVSSDTEVEVRVRWKDGQVEVETDVDREN